MKAHYVLILVAAAGALGFSLGRQRGDRRDVEALADQIVAQRMEHLEALCGEYEISLHRGDDGRVTLVPTTLPSNTSSGAGGRRSSLVSRGRR
ncbi:MAG TPA: hypothetical protein VFC78_22050 [Tepidisphaeraceae bacterium]|nr:hypothetical protein [Tepidisphaeraceae bacterium]